MRKKEVQKEKIRIISKETKMPKATLYADSITIAGILICHINSWIKKLHAHIL